MKGNRKAEGIWKKKEGFTLIEAVCALGLLVVVILGFTILVTAAGKNNISSSKLRSSYDAGIRAMAADWTSDVDSRNGTLTLKAGDRNIQIPIICESTKKSEDTAYLEKFVPAE